MPLRIALAVFVAALLAAPSAYAATAQLDRGTLTYTAGPSEANDVTLSLMGADYVLHDAGVTIDGRRPCRKGLPGWARCPANKVERIVIELDDGADAATVADSVTVPVECAACAAPQADPEPVAPAPEPLVPETELAGAPPIEVSSAPVRVDAQGRVPVAVSCPPDAPGGCAGRVTVGLPSSKLRSAKRAVRPSALGTSEPFKLDAGQSKVVKVRLDRRARRIIKRRGGGRRRVKLTVTVEVATSSGTETASSTIIVNL